MQAIDEAIWIETFWKGGKEPWGCLEDEKSKAERLGSEDFTTRKCRAYLRPSRRPTKLTWYGTETEGEVGEIMGPDLLASISSGSTGPAREL